MSSTERAPEPTMEEILASIRRIISDDEANAAQPEAALADQARPASAEESEEGAADTQIIDDIARVLSGANPPVATEEDEILDLTDLGVPAEAASGTDFVEEIVVAEFVEEVSVEPGPPADFASAFPSAPEAIPMPAPAAPSMAAPVFEAPQPAAEDPTAALERAIEALKAGDLAAFARVAENKYVPPAAPVMPSAPPPMSQEELPSAGPSLAEQLAAEEPIVVQEEEFVIVSEPELEPAPAPAMEEVSESWSAPIEEEPASWSAPEEPAQPEAVSTPWQGEDAAWPPKTSPMPEFAAPAPRTNGGSGHKTHDFEVASPKSLEDSVKEMLRPMLRKWLDENMQRVLTQALREELEDSHAPRRD